MWGEEGEGLWREVGSDERSEAWHCEGSEG